MLLQFKFNSLKILIKFIILMSLKILLSVMILKIQLIYFAIAIFLIIYIEFIKINKHQQFIYFSWKVTIPNVK